MGEARVPRRLAASLAADVVGYSRLMGKDEDRTLDALKVCRRIGDGLIRMHGGRIFGTTGDSVIAEFVSPVEALRCATEIQLQIHAQNADVPERSRMRSASASISATPTPEYRCREAGEHQARAGCNARFRHAWQAH